MRVEKRIVLAGRALERPRLRILRNDAAGRRYGEALRVLRPVVPGAVEVVVRTGGTATAELHREPAKTLPQCRLEERKSIAIIEDMSEQSV